MNSTFKNILKDCIPPVILKLLRPERPNPDPWANLKFAEGSLTLPGGGEFQFRPSLADREVCKQVFFNQDYALKRVGRSKELLNFYEDHDAPIIVDAGANIGAASVWFALAFPRARIIAVEPDVENYEFLRRNAETFSSVLPIQAAVASIPGELFLTDPGQGAWGYRTSLRPEANSYSVRAMTIEEVMAEVSGGTPFILKIDIEGAEADLFSRHSEVFNQFPLVIIELHDWMLPAVANSQNFLRWHTEKGRDFIFFGENVFSISNSISQRRLEPT